MKSTLAVILSLSISITAFAGGAINFSTSIWTDVQAQSAKEKKYVFLDCYTDWCGWCKVMDREAFVDSTVTQYINSNFIPTKREMEKNPEGVALSMKYHINGFPTYCIFAPNGNLVHKIIGYKKPDEFLAELKIALTKTDSYAPGFSTTLDPGFPDFYRQSFGTGKKRKWPEEKTVTDFLDSQKDLFSEVCWSIMWRFNLNEKYETWIFENKEKLSALYSKEEVEDKIISIFWDRNDAAAGKNDEAAFNKNITDLEKYVPDLAAKGYKMLFAQNFYKKTDNWKKYAEVTQSYIDTAKSDINSSINGWAWTIYEDCDDKTVIKQAVGWMEKVCAKTDEYAYEDTYASLLYKDGQYAKSEEIALHAIDIGKTAGEDVSATESLLANIRLKIK